MQAEGRDQLNESVSHSHRWGLILAGGDGRRLLPLTRRIAGDDRPKQFCTLLEEAVFTQITTAEQPLEMRAAFQTASRFYCSDSPKVGGYAS